MGRRGGTENGLLPATPRFRASFQAGLPGIYWGRGCGLCFVESELIDDLSIVNFCPESKFVDSRFSYCRQHFLNFLPLPQGQGSLRPTVWRFSSSLSMPRRRACISWAKDKNPWFQQEKTAFRSRSAGLFSSMRLASCPSFSASSCRKGCLKSSPFSLFWAPKVRP